MKSNSDFKNILNIFETRDNFLLTSHTDPDGDSVGSIIGLANFLRSLGKKVALFNEGHLPERYKFLDPDGRINFESVDPGFKPEIIVVLECPEIGRIGFVQDLITDDMTIVNIDHHPKNTRYGEINYIDETACAVAEVLFQIIRTGNHDIPREVAEPFYAAIASDTGRFKFTNTDSKCFKVASELVKAGANPKAIADKIFSSHRPGTIKLLGKLLEKLELHADGKICILKLQLKDLQQYGVEVEDTEGIIDYSLVIRGVKVGILFKERDETTVKVGLRSQNGIDISKYARSKGGGGHVNAAGFTISEKFDDAVKQVTSEVAEFLNG